MEVLKPSFFRLLGGCLLFFVPDRRHHNDNTDKALAISTEQRSQRLETVQENCSKKINIVFLKVYKCASETTMRILWRFVMKNNLNPLMKYYTPATIVNNMSRPRLLPVPDGETYNVFASHVNFTLNKAEIRKRMPTDTVYVGTVRRPMSQFLSSLSFRNIYTDMKHSASFDSTNMSYADLLRKSIEIGSPIPGQFRNEQSEYFGIRGMHTGSAVDDVMKKFILIIIVEFYDESLILLKRYLCWELKDIIYRKEHVNKYRPGQTNIHPVTRQWFEQAYSNDIYFYQRCLKEFHRKVAVEGESFLREVQNFRTVLAMINEFCQSETDAIIVVRESPWNKKFEFSLKDCKFLKNVSNNVVRAWQFKKTGQWDNNPDIEYMKPKTERRKSNIDYIES